MLKTTVATAEPAFNGYAVLPRLIGWEDLRRSLSRSPLDGEPDLGRFLATPLGARYARSLTRAKIRPAGLSVLLSLESWPEPRLRIDLRFSDLHGAAWSDRWELDVDALGVVTGARSESRIGDWAFSARDFSRFLGVLLSGL